MIVIIAAFIPTFERLDDVGVASENFTAFQSNFKDQISFVCVHIFHYFILAPYTTIEIAKNEKLLQRKFREREAWTVLQLRSMVEEEIKMRKSWKLQKAKKEKQ